MGELQRVDLTEFLLTHGELAAQPLRGMSYNDNGPCFRVDFREGRLDRYKGTYVAYQKGILCGQSVNKDKLHYEAGCYYGDSSLAVFRVPEEGESIEDVLEEAVGNF